METELTFLIDPQIVSGIDLANAYCQAPKPLLNLITSKFPKESFSYPTAKTGKPFLACNEFPITKGKISVFLYVLQERHPSGWLDCGMLFNPPQHHLRPGYEPNQNDSQLIEDLLSKIKAALIDDLGAKDVIMRGTALPPHLQWRVQDNRN